MLSKDRLAQLKHIYKRTCHLDDTRETAVINELIEEIERLQIAYDTKCELYIKERDRADQLQRLVKGET